MMKIFGITLLLFGAIGLKSTKDSAPPAFCSNGCERLKSHDVCKTPEGKTGSCQRYEYVGEQGQRILCLTCMVNNPAVKSGSYHFTGGKK